MWSCSQGVEYNRSKFQEAIKAICRRPQARNLPFCPTLTSRSVCTGTTICRGLLGPVIGGMINAELMTISVLARKSRQAHATTRPGTPGLLDDVCMPGVGAGARNLHLDICNILCFRGKPNIRSDREDNAIMLVCMRVVQRRHVDPAWSKTEA
jgi:hypothetical protein